VEFLHVQFVMVFYRNQEVVIVGAGILLVKKRIICLSCVKVTMLVRSEKFRASKVEARVHKTPKIPS
jgi:thioredoxin reductase (NADPH)